MFQLAKAHHYAKTAIGMPKLVTRPRRQQRDKLRIGYVSSDLREHAVGFAMTDVVRPTIEISSRSSLIIVGSNALTRPSNGS